MKNSSSLFQPMRRGPARSHQRGFSLIEVLVSVLLLSLGVLGLIGLQVRTMQMSGEAEYRNRAAMLADDLASRMWMAHTVTLPAADVTAWEEFIENPQKSGLPNATGTIAAATGTGVPANSVNVTITWRSPTRDEDDDSTLSTRIVLSRDPTP